MKFAIKQWLDNCLEKHKSGELTTDDLYGVEDALKMEKQIILYLYSKSTNPRSPIGAWSIFDVTVPDEPVLP